jgi:hypothetical protein
MDSKEAFFARLDHAILSGEGSGNIGKRFGVNPTMVRRRRSTLRKSGYLINIRCNEARNNNANKS